MTLPYDLGKPHRNRARRWAHLVLCAGLGLTLTAHAGSDFVLMNGAPTTVPLPGGGWKVIPPAPGSSPDATRIWLGRMVNGTTSVEEALQIAGRGGAVPARVQQVVKVADAAGAVARCLKAPVVCAAIAAGVAAGAYYFYRKYGVKPDGNGGLVADPGQPQEQHPKYNCGVSPDGKPSFDGTSPEAACKLAIKFYDYDYVDVNGAHRWRVSTLTSCTPTACTFDYSVGSSRPGYPTISDGSTATIPVAQVGTIGLCPAVVNFYDPAYSTPGGPPGPDGLCPTGNYSQPVTVEEAQRRVIVYPPPDDDTALPGALREAVEHGQAVPSTIRTTGPATQTGQPVSTTTTDAKGTSTSTQTPTYSYHYDGDQITYDTTVTTTVINNDGSTSSSSTTTSGPSPDKEPKDPCDLHPERVGCMGLGSPPDDTVKKTQSQLSWQTESLGFGASCPSDLVIQQRTGPAITLTYRDACDTATRLKPLVIAAGALVALLMVTAALRNA